MNWFLAPENTRLGPTGIVQSQESSSIACGELGVGVGDEQGMHGCDLEVDSSGNVYSNEDSGI